MSSIHKIFILCILLAFSLSAADFRATETVYVDEGDTLLNDLFAGARIVDVLGYVKGDVYIGAEHVRIVGNVEDDVLAGCKILEIKGHVGDVVIGFAQTIIIDGEVEGDVLAYGGEVRITKSAYIMGDLYVGTGFLSFEGGRIDGGISGGGNKAYLNGTTGSKVNLQMEEIKFGPDYSSIKGTTLKLKGELPADIENLPADLQVEIQPEKKFYQGIFFYWSFIAMLVVGVLLITLFKNFSREILSLANKNIAKNLGSGFVFLILVPVVFIILLVLLITIPVALIILALYLILLYLSVIITSLFLGNYILNIFGGKNGSVNLFPGLLIGLIAAVLLPQIPFVGWLFCLLIISFGMGNLVVYLWQLYNLKPQAE